VTDLGRMNGSRSHRERLARTTLLMGVSVFATGFLAAPAFAQANAAARDGNPPDTGSAAATADSQAGTATPAANAATGDGEIVITGIRASLERSMDIKRNSSGPLAIRR